MQYPRVLALVILLATSTACVQAAQWPQAPAADSLFQGRWLTVPGTANPHGDPDACVACHTGPGEADQKNVVVESCRECHDASAHSRRIHSVDRRPGAEGRTDITIPETLPQSEKGLDCLTCHGKSCTPDRANRAMLRGAPWEKEQQFCFQCHRVDSYQGLNPHTVPLSEASARQLSEAGLGGSCQLCHSSDPIFSGAALKAAAQDLCRRCHRGKTHQARHVGVSLSADAASTVFSLYSEYKNLGGTPLPLDAGEVISCTTCHFAGAACRNDQEQGRAYPPNGLRLTRELICHVCHKL